MAAPTRTAPQRVSNQGLLSRSTDSSAIYAAQNNANQPPMVISQPGRVRTQDDINLEKFAQLAMYIVALIAIWGGIFSIAFDENATNSNFLMLFIGGLVSAAMAISWIELQSKKNAHQLMEVQNYMLGLGFFFATVGTLWGARYLMGFATGTLDLELFGDPDTYESIGDKWQPNANGIYMQVIAIIALLLAEIKLLKRYKGATTFGWGVAIYSPLALMVAGIGTWIEWSNNIVSYELGIAIIVLSFVSMEAALRSNKSMHFFVVAIVSGLIPILYELFNTNAPAGGEGGALSLLIFIIAIQGYYASKQELRSDLMQKASVLLVGEVLIAIFIARINDLNLILGPLRAENIGMLAEHLTLPVMLWVTVLIAYFPAVMQRRVPWMPIGLAFSLFFLPTESNMIPWIITLMMIPYMLFINTNTRKWVADFTVAMIAVSFFMTDLLARMGGFSYAEIFSIDYAEYIVPIALVIIAEYGFKKEKISSWAHLSIVCGVVLSRAILGAEEWFLPWVFVAYILYIANYSLKSASESNIFNDRKEASLTIVIALGSTLLLAIFGKLNLPESADVHLSGFNLSLMILGIGSYYLLRIGRNVEFDIGMLLNWKTQKKNATTFNSELNAWVEVDTKSEDYIKQFEQNWLNKSWGSLARMGMIVPLVFMTIAIASVEIEPFAQNPIWVMLLAIPVAILVYEILALDKISSVTRATGVWMLVLMAIPMILRMQIARFEATEKQLEDLGGLIPAAIVLDLILIAAPFIVNSQINKRGIDDGVLSKNADVSALAGLLLLAMMDSSGGLLLLSMFVLVTSRAIKHRHNMLLLVSPLIFAFVGTSWLEEFGLAKTILDAIEINVEYGFLTIANISGWIIAIQMGIVWIIATRTMDDDNKIELPWWGSMAWVAVGLIAAMSEVSWMPTVFTIMLTGSAIYRGKVSFIPAMPIAFFFSLLVGMSSDANFVDLNSGEIFGWSAIATAFFTLSLSAMEMTDWLYSKCDEVDNEIEKWEMFSPSVQAGRDQISDALRMIGIVAFLFSFDIAVGIGPVIAAVWVTYIAIRKGNTNGLLLMPLLHGISIANCLSEAEIASAEIRQLVVGVLMAIEGGVLIYFSTQNDKVYDWQTFNWESDNDFLDFMDYLGMGGLLSAISGTWYAFEGTSIDSFSWLIMTVLFTMVAIQGFSKENDARWRRGFGGFGSLVTAFIFANTLDSEIFQALGYVFLGILGFGYGAMFSQRIGEEGEIYLADEQSQSGLLQATIANPVMETQVQGGLLQATKKIAAKEEEPPEIVEVIEIEQPVPIIAPAEITAIHDGLIETADGFAIRLPGDVVQNILNSINNTPHEGFKPVLGFSPSGQVMLNFETE